LVTISLAGEGGAYLEILGSLVAQPDGRLNGNATVPADAPTTGIGLLSAEGAGEQGETLRLTALVRLGASLAVDSDSDGVPDLCDVCASASDPGQPDADGDRRGDACDPCPTDVEDDFDGDGICADSDVCEYDPFDDEDGDDVCGDVDNCRVDAK
jgi:hypothetical protein